MSLLCKKKKTMNEQGMFRAITVRAVVQSNNTLTLARFLYFATFPSGGGWGVGATPLAFGN